MNTQINMTAEIFTTNFHQDTNHIITENSTATSLVKAAKALGLNIPAKMNREKTINRFLAERAKQLAHHLENYTFINLEPTKELEVDESEKIDLLVKAAPLLVALKTADKNKAKGIRAKLRRLGYYLSGKREK